MIDAPKPTVAMTDISGRGGQSQQTFCLAQALAPRVDLLYLVTRQFEFAGKRYSFRVKNILATTHDKKSKFLKGIVSVFNLWRILFTLVKYRPQLYHFHDTKIPIADALLLHLLRRLGIKIVYEAHNVIPHEADNMSGALRKIYTLTHATIVHAQANKDDLVKEYRMDPGKLHVIPGGSYTAFYDDYIPDTAKSRLKQELGMAPEIFTLIFFGYIRAYKGLDLLLQAFALLQTRKIPVQLAIVGEPVEDFCKYDRLLKSLPKPEHVLLKLEYVDTSLASRYLMASDVVVLPYRNVHQSGVVYIAYAHRCPVIATRVGGLPELIEEGKSGLLIPPDDIDSLGLAIESLVREPGRAREMGEYAFRLSTEKHAWSWNNAASKTLALYSALLSSSALTERADE